MAVDKSLLWRFRYARWGRRAPQEPGYTLLIPVPGDLPVFLDLALAVCALQDTGSRVSTLVLPDVDTPAVRAAVARAQPAWRGRLELVRLPLPDRWLLPALGDPGRNHASQLLAGVRATGSTHLLLHDADLFLLDDGIHERQFRSTRDRGLDVLGVDGPWDPWFARHDLHLAATWELTARTDWLRSFPPYRHFGHDAEMFGEQHTFDTTFWAQAHTPGSRVAVDQDTRASIVHFNYVISSYRKFQRSTGPVVDERFRLLFIRLLIDLFAHERSGYDVPAMSELAEGLTSTRTRVVYEPGAAATYLPFREQVEAILQGAWSGEIERSGARTALRPFDEAYGWQGRSS